MILAVRNIVKEEPTMVEYDVPEGHKLTVCGDTHGQFFDLLEIFRLKRASEQDTLVSFQW